jgi:hypothetical protein
MSDKIIDILGKMNDHSFIDVMKDSIHMMIEQLRCELAGIQGLQTEVA